MKRSLATWILLLLAAGGYAQTTQTRIRVSDDIELVKLSDKAYLHVSTVEMPPYGKVSANGLLVIDQGKALLFDSPWTNEQTEILLDWIADSLRARVTAFVPNHWHEDCMGGLECLHRRGIPSYANRMTVEIAAGKGLPVPQQSFTDSITLKLNDIEVDCYYLGAGHATDNIVVWIPSERYSSQVAW